MINTSYIIKRCKHTANQSPEKTNKKKTLQAIYDEKKNDETTTVCKCLFKLDQTDQNSNPLHFHTQNETSAIAPTSAATSLQLLQQLQASSAGAAATPVASNPAPNALSSVQHQLLLQQHLGLSGVTPAQTANVPSAPEISSANLQNLATLASLSGSASEYG